MHSTPESSNKAHMPTCDRCGTSDMVDFAHLSDGNLTCHGCGKVLDDSQNYRNEVDIMNTGGHARVCGSVVSLTSDGITASTCVPRNNSMHRRTEIQNPVQKQIDLVGTKLNVGETMLSQMHLTHTKLNKEDKYTRSPDVLAAVIIYIVLRQNNKPYTLLDVSHLIQKNVFLVGRVYDLVLRRNRKVITVHEVDPSVYVDKVCKEIVNVSPAVLATIKTYANQIINAIKPHWAHTGQRLDAVCVAAIYIAAEAAGTFSSFKALCRAIKAAEGTAKNRTKEIKQELLQILSPKLPWLREIGVKDIHKHLGKMLSQLEIITRLTDARTAPQSQVVNNHTPESPSLAPPRVVAAFVASKSDPEPFASPSTPPNQPTPSIPVTPSFTTSIPNNNNFNLNTYFPARISTYIDKKEDFNQKPLPTAFLANVATRSRRQQKLENAKLRLRDSLDRDPELVKYYSPNVIASFASLPPTPLSPPHPPSPVPPSPPPPTLPASDTKIYPIAPTYKKRSPPVTPSTPPARSPSSPTYPSSPQSKTFAELANAPTKPAKWVPLSTRRRAATIPKVETKEKKDIPPVAMPSLDHEDLIIEKMLLKGVSEAQILDGYYFSEQLQDLKHPSFHSEVLGEDDIPESEMNNFIRSQAEVDILTKFEEKNALEEEGKQKQKKKKATTKRRRGTKEKKKAAEEKHPEQEASEQEAGEPEAEVYFGSETELDEPLQRKKLRSTNV